MEEQWGDLPEEMWQEIRDHVTEGAGLAVLADVSQDDRRRVARRPGVYLVDDEVSLATALDDQEAKFIIVMASGMVIHQAPSASTAKVITRRQDMTVSGEGLLYLVGETASATVTGGMAYAYNQATITAVTGGTVYASDRATITTVTGGSAYAYRQATITAVTGGTVHAVGQATITTVTGGTVHAYRQATITTVTGGSAHAFEQATITAVNGGQAFVCGQATITTITGGEVDINGQATVSAGGSARVKAWEKAHVIVAADGEDVTVDAFDRAVVDCYAGTVNVRHKSVTVNNEGGTVHLMY